MPWVPFLDRVRKEWWWWEHHSTQVSLFLGLGLMILVGWIDHLTGSGIRLTLFYLPAILLMSWFAPLGGALLVIVFSVLLWYFLDQIGNPPGRDTLLAGWNMLMKIGYAVALAIIFSRLKRWLTSERSQARTDPLTGLTNRRGFREIAEVLLAQTRRSAKPVSVLYLDVNDFKAINDRWGHAAGDEVLRAVGRTLRSQTRRGDLAVRLGGDEFVLLMFGADRHAAARVQSRLVEALAHRTRRLGWPTRCSMGLVTFQPPEISLDEMITTADRLMYESKRRQVHGAARAWWRPNGLVRLPELSRAKGGTTPGRVRHRPKRRGVGRGG